MAWWEDFFMRTVEKVASTVESAIENGLLELGVAREQVNVEILQQEGRRGFLGLFGMKMAKVKLTLLDGVSGSASGVDRQDAKKTAGRSAGLSGKDESRKSASGVSSEDAGELACQFLKDVVGAMGVEASFDVVNKDDQLTINISGNDLGMLIGRRGDTLEAIQYITNLAVSKKMAERKRLIVDIEGYRKRREETLVRLAQKLADKAVKTGNRVVLEPMSPQERRMIHMALQDDTAVATYSEGQEPNRRVVISPKGRKSHTEDQDLLDDLD
jgi:spoIIIJ-associated protein